jgi:hypothetical protein
MSVRTSLFVLCALNLVCIALSIFATHRALDLTNDLRVTRTEALATVTALRAGCMRGNVQREAQRYNLRFNQRVAKVVAEFAATEEIVVFFRDVQPELEKRLNASELAAQDCEALYPLPRE